MLRYLRDWCDLSKGIDIATGYFEIGSLLALDGQWQKLDKIRILMGDEVSKRTRAAFAAGLAAVKARLDQSLEAEKEKNDFLAGAPAIVDALRAGKIQCRVYRKDKFHAKAYITHARQEVIGSFALVGSSNMTYPGLTENIELNVQVPGTPVAVLQEWYEEHWAAAEDVTADILRTIERHVREYTPLEVYAKSLAECCRSHMLSVGEWEQAGEPRGSHMYAELDRYQQEGYQALMKIAREHGGAFLCDGVGLGKTFIGLMVGFRCAPPWAMELGPFGAAGQHRRCDLPQPVGRCVGLPRQHRRCGIPQPRVQPWVGVPRNHRSPERALFPPRANGIRSRMRHRHISSPGCQTTAARHEAL